MKIDLELDCNIQPQSKNSPVNSNSSFENSTTKIPDLSERPCKSSVLANAQPLIRLEPIIMKCLFAEPLFSKIEFGLPYSEDYMSIESLFSDSTTSFEGNMGNSGEISEVVNGLKKAKNIVAVDAVGSDVLENVYTVDNADAVTMNENCKSYCDANDVTVLPEKLTSYSHCLYFTSVRSNRLCLLRKAATWRVVKLIVGWIMLYLFVYWLS